MANTDYISTGTTVFSNISISGDVRASSASASVITSATVAVQGGPVLGSASLDLRTNSAVISMATVANSNGMSIGQLRLVFAASGVSLVYSSGSTVYTVGASAVSAAQA